MSVGLVFSVVISSASPILGQAVESKNLFFYEYKQNYISSKLMENFDAIKLNVMVQANETEIKNCLFLNNNKMKSVTVDNEIEQDVSNDIGYFVEEAFTVKIIISLIKSLKQLHELNENNPEFANDMILEFNKKHEEDADYLTLMVQEIIKNEETFDKETMEWCEVVEEWKNSHPLLFQLKKALNLLISINEIIKHIFESINKEHADVALDAFLSEEDLRQTLMLCRRIDFLDTEAKKFSHNTVSKLPKRLFEHSNK